MISLNYIKDSFALSKPRITVTVLFIAYCGMWIGSQGNLDYSIVAITFLGLALAASASGTLNNYIDRDIDPLMERTSGRVLPTGRIKPSHALINGVTYTILSVLVLSQVSLLTAAVGLFTIFFYVFIYTAWLKRSTPLCTFIGGVAGSMPPIIGFIAVEGQNLNHAWVLFLILFIWQPPHFWALAILRASEYKKAGIPMLPVVKGAKRTGQHMIAYTVILVPVSLLPWWVGMCGVYYLGAVGVFSSLYLFFTLRFASKLEDHVYARKLFKFSILYIIVIFAMLFLDSKFPTLS